MPTLFAQDYFSQAKEIRNVDAAKDLADSVPQILYGFLHDELNNEDYRSRMKNLEPGDWYSSGGYRVVVIAAGSKRIYRFRTLSMTRQKTPDAKTQVASLLEQVNNGTSFESLFDQYAENSGPDAQVYGDVGWVDLDFFVDSFQEAVAERKKGERFVAGDEERGWFNLVEMTHKPKKKKGHFVLLIPNTNPKSYFETIDHQKNISKLSSRDDLFRYAEKYPGDVMIQMLNQRSDVALYNRFASEENRAQETTIIKEESTNYQFIKDTTVELFSIQYIYLNGAQMTRDARSEAIHDIYDQFHSNVPFDSIVSQYWPDNNGLSQLRNIEGALLAEDLVEKVRSTTVGQLFVARVGQSYFLGVPLEKPKQVDAVLVIAYPNTTEE